MQRPEPCNDLNSTLRTPILDAEIARLPTSRPMLHPADLATFAAHADESALQAIEGRLTQFVHELAPHHADGLTVDAMLLRAVIANATVADDVEPLERAVSAAA